jgi:hypothetical protein
VLLHHARNLTEIFNERKFTKPDYVQIAAKLGIEETALIRVRAGISFALAEAMDDGHRGLPNEDFSP